jgi:hypothetical protein
VVNLLYSRCQTILPATEENQRLAVTSRGDRDDGAEDDGDIAALDDLVDGAVEGAEGIVVDGRSCGQNAPFTGSETRCARDACPAAEGIGGVGRQEIHRDPDRPTDRLMYERLRDADYDAWRQYPGQAVEDSGQQKILNWLCLVGALSPLGRKPQETGFVDTRIFNSPKAFLIAPP